MSRTGSFDDVGKLIRLVAWTNSRDGWEPRYAYGRVVENTSGEWLLEVEGSKLPHSKDEWSVYSD